MAITVSIVSSYGIVLYSLEFGNHRSMSWLISLVETCVQENIIIQPGKVIVLAAFSTFIKGSKTGPVVPHPNYLNKGMEVKVIVGIENLAIYTLCFTIYA